MNKPINLQNISPDWTGSTRKERRIIERIMTREATGGAIRYFSRNCDELSDYWYWFILGTLWVSYTGFSDLELWKTLFLSRRKNRDSSLMKPNELKLFKVLPENIIAYRAHRENETDWLSYTMDIKAAVRFANERKATSISKYTIQKTDVFAYFLRRGESELLVLDRDKAKFMDAAVKILTL